MKCALITTTINIPHVLKLYRACGPDVRMFVAMDKKSPPEAYRLCFDLGIEDVFQPTVAKYECDALIGHNTIARRNIALLEALKWGAEIIVTIDDDNIPMSTDYFDRFEMVLDAPFSGLAGATVDNWFDPGCLIHPHARHRGFPVTIEAVPHFYGPVVCAKVGVAAGLCLGDPDISAVDRISQAPIVQNVSQLAHNGVIVLPSIKTVFNSQNTAFLRELAPCFLMCPQFGRYDDIFASLIAQRVMRERNLHVHFGQPFVWQQRNPHNLLKDLAAETWGMNHITEFADWLDQLDFPEPLTPIDMCRYLWGVASGSFEWMPDSVSELGLAWCEDVEKVL